MRSVSLARLVMSLALGVLASLPASAGSPFAETIRVEMTEFAFHPAVIRLKVGVPVRLQFMNRGQIAHQFESEPLRKLPVWIVDEKVYVEAPGVDILRLAPGASARLEFVPRVRNRVEFSCTIEGHREAGMRGRLEVR